MNSQNASASLPGRGCCSGFGAAEMAGDAGCAANGDVNGDVNCALGLSIEHLAAFGERFDAVQARGVADARRGGNVYGAARRDFHFRLDDVFGPIAAAGGKVAGLREIRQRGHSDVMRAADAGFQHASAPHGDGFLLAEIVDAAGGSVAADAAELHIDNFAGADFDGGAGVLDIVDALVQANGSFELALQRGVGIDVVVAQRLFDHDQVEGVEPLQVRRVFQAIGGIGVHHQANARKSFAEGAGGFEVVARLDFYFDALVAGGQFFFHFG